MVFGVFNVVSYFICMWWAENFHGVITMSHGPPLEATMRATAKYIVSDFQHRIN